jgi:hypothetical protein
LIYGSFYRINDSIRVTDLQIRDKQIWGGVARHTHTSDILRVKAYTTDILVSKNDSAVRFTTDVAPDPNTPSHLAFWSGPRPGVLIENNYAKINVVEIDYYP